MTKTKYFERWKDNIMATQLYIEMENNSHNKDSIIPQLKTYSINTFETHSSAAIEITTLIITIGQFIIALIEVPALFDLFSLNKIIVKIGGVKISNSVDDLIRIIKSNPDLFQETKKALQSHTLEIEGKGKAVIDFLEKLNDMINEDNRT